jgi:pyruvate dehydrogenase E2 component (dihydrolipoamide acetyltransferase)
MATEFQMPKLGLTMEAGTILDWLVADGDEVAQGVAVLVIETDKVESEVEASGSGLLHMTGLKGETYACGERIGWFLDPGETAPADAPRPTASPNAAPIAAGAQPSAAVAVTRGAGGRLFASPNARRIAAERGVDIHAVVGTGPGGRVVSEDVLAAPVGSAAPSTDRPATIAARQLADLLGIDIGTVTSSGPDPRIDRDDVARHVRATLAGDAPVVVPTEAPLLQTPSSTVPMTGMRGTIAGRMHASLQQMAQLTLTMDVVMDAVIRDRSDGGYDTRPGYTDYVIAAVAGALGDHPVVNSQIAGDELALLPEINVGMAVAIDGGLMVPVVHAADTLTIEELSTETTRLAGAARDGGLALTDLEGGTFSVTALGMFGVDAFTPVINPPNTGILGVGRLRDGVRWDGDVVTKTRLLTLSLTWDHRAFDGAPAAEFVAGVRDRLENWGSAT